MNFRIHLCSSFRCGTGIRCCYGPRHGNPNVRVTLPLPRSHSANMGEPRGPGIIPNTGWGSSRPTSGKPQRRVQMCKCADEPARSGACPKPPIRHAALLGFEPKPVTSERVFFTVKLRRVCAPLSDLGLSSIDVWSWMMLCRGPGGCCALHCQMLSTSPGSCPPGASNSLSLSRATPKCPQTLPDSPGGGQNHPCVGTPALARGLSSGL